MAVDSALPSSVLVKVVLSVRCICKKCGASFGSELKLEAKELPGEIAFAKVISRRRKPYTVLCRCGHEVRIYPQEIRLYDATD